MPSRNMMHTPLHITQEEFNLFHAIDRRLFSILVFALGKDPNDATQVMALWLWLERVTLKSTIVHVILSLPYQTIDTLFNESMLCLHVASFGPTTVTSHIPVLTALLSGKNIIDVSLPYFYENKTLVLQGVAKIVEDVCLRAFRDIVETLKAEGSVTRSGGGSRVVAEESRMRRGFDFDSLVGAEKPGECNETSEVGVDLEDEIDEELYLKWDFLNIDEKLPREEDRLGEGRENLRGGARGSNNKTLFLTFSKGYPITKSEVKDFFNRYFGDIIEGLHMQEVGKNEQPLYARLVVRDVSMLDIVLQGQRKVKFSINGKHACVRKYVRRRSESPPTPPPGLN